jgi:ABC-type dipeptide/oligopeptide/nickel transport system ATPase component
MASSSKVAKTDGISKSDLISKIDKVANSALPAIAYGVFPAVRFEDYRAIIEEVNDQQFEPIKVVLVPYFDGLEARLAAVKERVARISLFLREINALYRNKEVTFSALRGFQVTGWQNRMIPFPSLSSGESQLFLLLISTLFIGEEGGVFIVDEPELSLNPKWQRVIIDTLLKLGSETKLQYLIATHSLEIMSGQKDRIILLKPEDALRSEV